MVSIYNYFTFPHYQSIVGFKHLNVYAEHGEPTSPGSLP